MTVEILTVPEWERIHKAGYHHVRADGVLTALFLKDEGTVLAPLEVRGECHWCGEQDREIFLRGGEYPAGEPVCVPCITVEEAKPWNQHDDDPEEGNDE